MKPMSLIAKLWKRGKSGCYVPPLAFDGYRVARYNRAAQGGKERAEEAFAAAYLSRAKSALERERREKAECLRADPSAPAFSAAADELDAMIAKLSDLRGLNVPEREFYARSRKT